LYRQSILVHLRQQPIHLPPDLNSILSTSHLIRHPSGHLKCTKLYSHVPYNQKLEKKYLKYFWIGRDTLSRRTPGGSNIRNALIVEIYCAMMMMVSAPGWRRRFAQLLVRLQYEG